MEKRLLLQELADLLAAREGITKKKADAFTRCFFEVVERGLETDKFVKIKGFGTFKIVSVSDRESVNINTGERFQISGHSKITFTPDAELRDLINRPFAHFQTVVLNESTDLAELEAVDAAEESRSAESLPNTTTAEDESLENSPEPATNEAEMSVFLPEIPEHASEADAPKEETTDLPATEEEPEESATPTLDEELPEEDSTAQEQETADMPAEEDNPDSEMPPVIPPTSATGSEGTMQEVSEPDATFQEAEGREEGETPMKPAETEMEEASANPEPAEECTQTDNSPQAGQSAGPQEAPAAQQPPVIVSLPSVPVPEKFNWWKAIAMFFIVLLLMVLSYFAGYFRLFCPCEFMDEWQARTSWTSTPGMQAQIDTAQHDTLPVPPKDTIASTQPDSSTIHPQAKPLGQPQATAPKTTESSPATSSTPVPAKPKAAATPPKPVEKPATSQGFAQVPGGKYRIVGTRQKYTVGSGETVRSIAEYVYGSKGYAPYIITHNHLRNPNNIAAGSVLLLPELEIAE